MKRKSQRDFQLWVIKRSSLERHYYVLAEIMGLFYVKTKDLIKIEQFRLQ